LILEYYRDKKLDKYLSELNRVESGSVDNGYIPEEKVLLKILANYQFGG
jgi:hypothetical protein